MAYSKQEIKGNVLEKNIQYMSGDGQLTFKESFDQFGSPLTSHSFMIPVYRYNFVTQLFKRPFKGDADIVSMVTEYSKIYQVKDKRKLDKCRLAFELLKENKGDDLTKPLVLKVNNGIFENELYILGLIRNDKRDELAKLLTTEFIEAEVEHISILGLTELLRMDERTYLSVLFSIYDFYQLVPPYYSIVSALRWFQIPERRNILRSKAIDVLWKERLPENMLDHNEEEGSYTLWKYPRTKMIICVVGMIPNIACLVRLEDQTELEYEIMCDKGVQGLDVHPKRRAHVMVGPPHVLLGNLIAECTDDGGDVSLVNNIFEFIMSVKVQKRWFLFQMPFEEVPYIYIPPPRSFSMHGVNPGERTEMLIDAKFELGFKNVTTFETCVIIGAASGRRSPGGYFPGRSFLKAVKYGFKVIIMSDLNFIDDLKVKSEMTHRGFGFTWHPIDDRSKSYWLDCRKDNTKVIIVFWHKSGEDPCVTTVPIGVYPTDLKKRTVTPKIDMFIVDVSIKDSYMYNKHEYASGSRVICEIVQKNCYHLLKGTAVWIKSFGVDRWVTPVLSMIYHPRLHVTGYSNEVIITGQFYKPIIAGPYIAENFHQWSGPRSVSGLGRNRHFIAGVRSALCGVIEKFCSVKEESYFILPVEQNKTIKLGKRGVTLMNHLLAMWDLMLPIWTHTTIELFETKEEPKKILDMRPLMFPDVPVSFERFGILRPFPLEEDGLSIINGDVSVYSQTDLSLLRMTGWQLAFYTQGTRQFTRESYDIIVVKGSYWKKWSNEIMVYTLDVGAIILWFDY